MRVTALAGGVGGAKLANGLAQCLNPADLSIIVNTGDDFIHWGLFISPDLDTVCYTLADLGNPNTGWGRVGETWTVLKSVDRLGGPDWFQIGDQDLATHLERTRRLNSGETLTAITRAFCTAWGIGPAILPMSDQPIPTIVITKELGPLPFQEYFVKHQCSPTALGFSFTNIELATPTLEVTGALEEADVVILCPSNPWVSIDPILSIPGIRDQIRSKPVVAVSPIIHGQTIKGPAAKMYREFGITPSAAAVAHHYEDLLSGFVYDSTDFEEHDQILAEICQYRTDVFMRSKNDQMRLASEVLKFCEELGGK
jgi:LPPG:FO 2-phospho-L-lactate transferase